MVETIKWPSWMKPPVVDGYGIEPINRRLVTEMEIGSVYRVEFDTDESVATCSLFLNPLGANWFEAFERDFLAQGSRWFYWTLFVGGQLVDHVVRFKDRPKLSEKSGDYSTYTFTLDIARREGLMPVVLVELLTALNPEQLMMMDEMLQKVVNVDLPKAMPFVA
jgi:hypothetical protein